MNVRHPLAWFAAIFAAVLMTGAICGSGDSLEGKSCASGSYATRVHDGKRTNYSCINERWRKVP